ncbi:hypothetical protein ABZ746_11075 [Streptomyces sp. NPDC020096]
MSLIRKAAIVAAGVAAVLAAVVVPATAATSENAAGNWGSSVVQPDNWSNV